jgi:hypothetical protein
MDTVPRAKKGCRPTGAVYFHITIKGIDISCAICAQPGDVSYIAIIAVITEWKDHRDCIKVLRPGRRFHWLAVLVPYDALQRMGRLGDQGRSDTIVVIGMDSGLVSALAPNDRGQEDAAVQKDKTSCRFGHGPINVRPDPGRVNV